VVGRIAGARIGADADLDGSRVEAPGGTGGDDCGDYLRLAVGRSGVDRDRLLLAGDGTILGRRGARPGYLCDPERAVIGGVHGAGGGPAERSRGEMAESGGIAGGGAVVAENRIGFLNH